MSSTAVTTLVKMVESLPDPAQEQVVEHLREYITTLQDEANVMEAVPFFAVSNMENSLRFYVDGLGFEMTHQWIDEGTVRWCWLRRDSASLMLQNFRRENGEPWTPGGPLGLGVSIMFICRDALAIYHEAMARGLHPSRPFVGNGMWVTSLRDPDGYSVEFESYTDVPEETVYAEDADEASN